MVNKTNDKDHSHSWDYMRDKLSDLTGRVKALQDTINNHRVVLQALLKLDYNIANQGQGWKI